MSKTKPITSFLDWQEQHRTKQTDCVPANAGTGKFSATVLTLTRPQRVPNVPPRSRSFVYFIQLTDLNCRPLSEYVGADLEIVQCCDDLNALLTFEDPESAIYFCRLYARDFQERRFRYRLHRPGRAQRGYKSVVAKS
jgi:hypothetical protein